MSLVRTPLALVVFLSASISTTAQFGPQFQFFCDGPRAVDLADFDGDGALDLMIASRQGLGLYPNTDGLGAFGSPTMLGVDETVACAADVNGDGWPDVIASREENNGLFLFMNQGNASFSDPLTIAAGMSADELHAADLDNDGDQDIYLVISGGSLAVCWNADQEGGFTAPNVVASMDEMIGARAVDMDSDGDPDLLFSSRVMNEVDVCFNDNGTFGPAQQVSVTGHGTAGDIDNDGHADILAANATAGLVGWQRNDPDAIAFGSPELLDQSFNTPEHVGVSDLDGDGDLDAIITSSVLEEVAWYENIDGQGDFGPHQTVAFDVPVSSMVTGDVDGDGDADLFVASAGLDKVIQFSNLSNATGGFMGRVFNDINGDGVFNGNDHGLVNMRVEATDLGATYTNASGMYWFDAVPTNYTVFKPAEDGWQFTTADAYELVVPAQGVSQHNDFGLQADGAISALTPDLGSAPMRCGMDISYWASVTNTGNQVGDVQLVLDLDDLSTYVTAYPAPVSDVNGTVTWLFPNVQPTHQRDVHIVVHLPGSDYVGQTLNDMVQATALIGGAPASITTVEYQPVLLCAVDPNDKHASPAGSGEQHLTPIGSTLTYHVRFQNTGNAPANTVTIVDTLDADLDHASLAILNSSHTCRALLGTDGVLSFTFENINLPDSGSDFIGSQGFVRFAIDHLESAVVGTVLNNTADIYFDNNAPVITNTTLNTLSDDEFTGVVEGAQSDPSDIQVLPNPAQGTATLRLGDGYEGRVDVQLFDAAGSLLRQMSRRSNTVVIERGGLPNGLYVIRATDERGTERTTRLAFE